MKITLELDLLSSEDMILLLAFLRYLRRDFTRADAEAIALAGWEAVAFWDKAERERVKVDTNA